jgi:hypothetical protein
MLYLCGVKQIKTTDMKLTNKDKKYLLSIGYEEEDFLQIEETVKYIRYEMLPHEKSRFAFKLNQKEVLEILGRDLFISGLGRTTFHGSAVRSVETSQGNTISVYFEKK